MADQIMWSGRGGISFYIKSSEIRGVKDFSISASVETEDKTENSEKFIKKKNSGSYQISLTAVLDAALGVDAQGLAKEMSEAARCGDSGYFYTANAKLFPSKFMCTDAKINNIQMTAEGKWKRCEVAWTLKQCSKYAGEASSSGGSGSGAKKSAGASTSKTTLGSLIGAVKGAVTGVQTAVKSVISAATSTLSAAKQASNAAKAALTTRKATNILQSAIQKVKSIFKK